MGKLLQWYSEEGLFRCSAVLILAIKALFCLLAVEFDDDVCAARSVVKATGQADNKTPIKIAQHCFICVITLCIYVAMHVVKTDCKTLIID